MFWNLTNKYNNVAQHWTFHAKGDLKKLISLSNFLKNLASTEQKFQSKWKFSLCLFLLQRLFKAESTMQSSRIRKEQACLHLLFCKYCHLLSCSISRLSTARLEECFELSRSKFPWHLHLHLDSRSALPWLEVSLSQMLSKSVMRDLLDSRYITDCKEKLTVSVSVERASVGSLCPELSCNHFWTLFHWACFTRRPLFPSLSQSESAFHGPGCHKDHPLFLFSFLSTFVSHSLSLSYSPTFPPSLIGKQSMTVDIMPTPPVDPLFSASSSMHSL